MSSSLGDLRQVYAPGSAAADLRGLQKLAPWRAGLARGTGVGAPEPVANSSSTVEATGVSGQIRFTFSTRPETYGAAILDMAWTDNNADDPATANSLGVDSGDTFPLVRDYNGLTDDVAITNVYTAVQTAGGWSAWSEDIGPVTPVGAITQAQVIATSPWLFWSPRDTSTLWQDTGKTTQADADTDPVQAIDDLSGNSRHAVQATNPALLSISGAVNSLATNDNNDSTSRRIIYPASVASLTAASLIFPFKSSDTAGVFCSRAGNEFIGTFESGSSSTALFGLVGTPTIKVDGSTFSGTTRGDLHTAVADGSWHTVEIHGINFSAGAWWSLIFGDYTSDAGFDTAANWGDILLYSAEPSAANISNVILPFLRQGVGL